jgi:hypothetical protein
MYIHSSMGLMGRTPDVGNRKDGEKETNKSRANGTHLGVIGELRALVPDAEEDGAVHHALPHARLQTATQCEERRTR